MSITLEAGIIPQNDARRLEALKRYQISGADSEASFNNIAHLMAEFFSTPIALVSIVDKDKVFFKGNVGMPDVSKTDRNVSLCSFAILSAEPTVFDKPLEEPCLLSNPLVHGSFGLRFYAGAPLITNDGFNIGSVCLIDKKERTFTAYQQSMLKRFAELVMHEIELRQIVINEVEISRELIVAKERFDLVAKATQDAIWDWNLLTNEIWWNEGFKELFGFQQEEIEPTIDSWYNRVHPEDRDWVVNGIHEVIDTGGKQWSAEYRFRKKDGSYAIVFDRGHALHDKDGKPYRMLGSMQNITEGKKGEALLVQKDKNFRSIIHHAPVAMLIFKGKDMVFETVNHSMLKIIEKTQDVIGKKLFDVLPEVKGQEIINVLNKVYDTGEPHFGNEWLVPLMRNGVMEDRYFNFAFTPVVEDGLVVGIMEVATEVTEQVTVRRKIEQNHQELQFVMDIMPTMVWSSLPDGHADFFNEVFLSYSGLPFEKLNGNQWTGLLHAEDLTATMEVWQKALSNGNFYEVEHRLRGQNGYRWFLTRGVPLKDEGGKIIKWYGTSTDINEQKHAETLLEQRVKERTQELEMRNKELEQFTFVSHHDLQEPLRKIVMFSDLVQSDENNKLTGSSHKMLDKVTNAARRMSVALRDVLNFASLSKEEQLKPVDMNEVLASVYLDLELVISEKKAKIKSNTLPTLKAIPGQMHQLLYNLVNNALKFSSPEYPPVILIECKTLSTAEVKEHTDLDQQKKYYKLWVKDNGIGFDQGHADKIFGMFQRLHNRDDYAGTGIGLALVKKVVVNHGGKIWAESSPGEGASFNILLPDL